MCPRREFTFQQPQFTFLGHQIKAFIRLPELAKIQFQVQRGLAITGKALIDKEWDSVTGDGTVWEDPVEADSFEPSDSQELVSPEGVAPPSAEGVLPLPPSILLFLSD